MTIYTPTHLNGSVVLQVDVLHLVGLYECLHRLAFRTDHLAEGCRGHLKEGGNRGNRVYRRE